MRQTRSPDRKSFSRLRAAQGRGAERGGAKRRMRGASAASCSCAAQPRPCRRAVPARHWTHRPSHSRIAFASRPGAATLRSMNTTRLSLLTIAAALALAGCGNKGPLVLPDAPDEAEAPVAADEADGAVDESADARSEEHQYELQPLTTTQN